MLVEFWTAVSKCAVLSASPILRSEGNLTKRCHEFTDYFLVFLSGLLEQLLSGSLHRPFGDLHRPLVQIPPGD